MNLNLPSNFAIENVIQSKVRGRVAYQGFVSSEVFHIPRYPLILLEKDISIRLIKSAASILRIIYQKEKILYIH